MDIDVTIRPDASYQILRDGSTVVAQRAASVDDARAIVLEHLVRMAQAAGTAVEAATQNEDGTRHRLHISPSGRVTVTEANANPAAPTTTAPTTTAPTTAVPMPPPVAAPAANSPATPSRPWPPHAAAGPARLAEGPPAPGPRGGGPAPAAPRRSFLTDTPVEEPATQGWRGVLTRLGIRMKPGADEQARRADQLTVAQHWPGPRTIVVVNDKGGASKTLVALMLAAAFALGGGAPVIVADNNQTRGTARWRTRGGRHDATVRDLLHHAERLLGTSAQSADLAHFVHHQPHDKYDVLYSDPVVLGGQDRIGAADVDTWHDVLAKFYRLIIVDTGNDVSDPVWRRAVERADQLVVATTCQEDRAEAGALLLEAFRDHGGPYAELARNAVVVVSQADPQAPAKEAQTTAAGFQGLARETVAIPFDPAMVDGQLSHSALRQPTRRAWLAAAAAVARGLDTAAPRVSEGR